MTVDTRAHISLLASSTLLSKESSLRYFKRIRFGNYIKSENCQKVKVQSGTY